eukprot:gene1024-612_t
MEQWPHRGEQQQGKQESERKRRDDWENIFIYALTQTGWVRAKTVSGRLARAFATYGPLPSQGDMPYEGYPCVEASLSSSGEEERGSRMYHVFCAISAGCEPSAAKYPQQETAFRWRCNVVIIKKSQQKRRRNVEGKTAAGGARAGVRR